MVLKHKLSIAHLLVYRVDLGFLLDYVNQAALNYERVKAGIVDGWINDHLTWEQAIEQLRNIERSKQ